MKQQHLDFLVQYHKTPEEQRPSFLNDYLKNLKAEDFDDFMDNYDIGLVDISLVQQTTNA